MLDEVQIMKGFEDILNDFLHINNLDVYVTDSNSKFLSSDAVIEFRRRNDEIYIYPLNFSKYCSITDNDWDHVWNEYCVYREMPMILKFNINADKADYLQSLFKKIYIDDVLELNNIRNKTKFERLIDIIVPSIDELTIVEKLLNSFKSVTNKWKKQYDTKYISRFL